MVDTEFRNLQTHSRDLSVGQRRTRAGASPNGLRKLFLIVSALFHKVSDGINIPFDLRCDSLCLQVGRRDVSITCRFASVIQVVKQLLDIG